MITADLTPLIRKRAEDRREGEREHERASEREGQRGRDSNMHDSTTDGLWKQTPSHLHDGS